MATSVVANFGEAIWLTDSAVDGISPAPTDLPVVVLQALRLELRLQRTPGIACVL